MKIRTKVLVLVFSLVLITGAVAIILSHNISSSIVEVQIGRHLKTAAQSRAHHIETLLDEYGRSVEMLAAGNPFKDVADPAMHYDRRLEQVRRRIDSTIEARKEISRVRVLDKKGIIIASSHEDIGHDLHVDEIFLRGKQKVHVGHIHTSKYTGNPVISVAAPILANGKFSGVVVVNFDAEEELYEITTDKTGMGETGEIYLVNKDGYMITPSRFVNDSFLKYKIDPGAVGYPGDIEHFAAPKHQCKAIAYENYMGTDILSVHAHIPEMGWCLMAELSIEEAFAPVTRLTHTMLLILALFSAGGIILSILISKKIAKPIVKLHYGTEQIVKGNLDYKVGTKTADEVGELSRAFDRMTANLKKSRDELEAYSKGLEERVEQRTKELAEKVKESEELRHASLNLLEDVNEAKNELEMAKEEVQKTNRKLKASNRELQDFVYVASHDLQEPIRKVSAFGQLLRDSLQGKLNEDEQENLAFMIDGASRMQQMIRDLLMYSSVSTKVKPAERVNLDEVIRNLKNVELAVLLEETSGTIYVPKPLLAVQADPSQVHQLLQNLVGNGLKYQRNGKRPEIVVRSSQEDDNTVRVEVEDNGIGIAEGNYDKIFVMFRRLHSLEEYEGTGIGLAVCKKIVDRHGGNIGVNSTIAEGSTFWFTLPAAERSDGVME